VTEPVKIIRLNNLDGIGPAIRLLRSRCEIIGAVAKRLRGRAVRCRDDVAAQIRADVAAEHLAMWLATLRSLETIESDNGCMPCPTCAAPVGAFMVEYPGSAPRERRRDCDICARRDAYRAEMQQDPVGHESGAQYSPGEAYRLYEGLRITDTD